MFTGIIEAMGKVRRIEEAGSNLIFWIESSISKELAPDQSVAHDGVCLTVEEAGSEIHRVCAVAETLQKTTLSEWKTGDLINLERCMKLSDRLDGHLVQGHVDTTGICLSVSDESGSWRYQFSYPAVYAHLLVEKGSVTVNGISLTVAELTDQNFCVAIIPYTYEHTNLQQIIEGKKVNLEFDILGKYVQQQLKTLKRP